MAAAAAAAAAMVHSVPRTRQKNRVGSWLRMVLLLLVLFTSGTLAVVPFRHRRHCHQQRQHSSSPPSLWMMIRGGRSSNRNNDNNYNNKNNHHPSKFRASNHNNRPQFHTTDDAGAAATGGAADLAPRVLDSMLQTSSDSSQNAMRSGTARTTTTNSSLETMQQQQQQQASCNDGNNVDSDNCHEEEIPFLPRYSPSQSTTAAATTTTSTSHVRLNQQQQYSNANYCEEAQIRSPEFVDSSFVPNDMSSSISKNDKQQQQQPILRATTTVESPPIIHNQRPKGSDFYDTGNVQNCRRPLSRNRTRRPSRRTTRTSVPLLSSSSSSIPLFGRLRVTVCQTKGLRPYMEDDYVVGPDCVAIFDGHGGKAVSRYLRQNLLAECAAATVLATTKGQQQQNPCSSSSSSTSSSFSSIQRMQQALIIALDRLDTNVQKILHWSFQGSTAVVLWFHRRPGGGGVAAGGGTLDNMRVVVVEPSQEQQAFYDDNDNNNNNIHNTEKTILDQRSLSTILAMDTTPTTTTATSTTTATTTTLIVANIGDSRAVWSRGGHAVPLTHDHKPDDPQEYARITALGGRVTCSRRQQSRGAGTSIPRVNGNLALSRAIGDRSERPYVTAEPDVYAIPLPLPEHDDGEISHNQESSNNNNNKDFIVLATDGLWDVMTNQEVVDFVHLQLQEHQQHAAAATNQHQNPCESSIADNNDHDLDSVTTILEEEDVTMPEKSSPKDLLRQKVTQNLVQEALTRGSTDNITVLIVWLS